MATAKRSFGWVQNPSNFETLKRLVGIFVPNSSSRNDLINHRLPLIKLNNKISEEDYNSFIEVLSSSAEEIPYALLKGRGRSNNTGTRSDALCSGIAQACIDGQKSIDYIDADGSEINLKKLFSDDWSADGFLRWAISLGLLEYSYMNDTCKISSLGRDYVDTADNSDEEKEILLKALMSYPPVMRVLSLLADGKHLTKFEIGSQLGFKGELGFTSISQDFFIALYHEAKTNAEREKIVGNIEGDADKYARMICSWLSKLGCVSSSRESRTSSFNDSNLTLDLKAYYITAKGLNEYKKRNGNSSNRRLPKVVMYEMLATKAADAGYLRHRRANLIQALYKARNIDELHDYLINTVENIQKLTILDDIEGLQRIGLEITKDKNGRYLLKDKIVNLTIPAHEPKKNDITELKEKIRGQLHHVNHDYLILIDLAYSDSQNKRMKNLDARNFEIHTANLLTKEISFKGRWLGGADKPDIIVLNDNVGVIIDTKAYKEGFSIGRNNEDEMTRYINQAQKMENGFPPNNWWRYFQENDVKTLHYLFVTSFLRGSFIKNLESIHQRSNVSGGAINVANLLCFAEHVKRNSLPLSALHSQMHNDEIVMPEL